MAPDSWESARGQNVFQTNALGWGGCKEAKLRLNVIAPDSWKCARSQNVFQTNALGKGGSLSSEKACDIAAIEEKR